MPQQMSQIPGRRITLGFQRRARVILRDTIPDGKHHLQILRSAVEICVGFHLVLSLVIVVAGTLICFREAEACALCMESAVSLDRAARAIRADPMEVEGLLGIRIPTLRMQEDRGGLLLPLPYMYQSLQRIRVVCNNLRGLALSAPLWPP